MKYKLTILAIYSTFLASAQMQPGFKDFDVAQGLSSSTPLYLNSLNGTLYFYAANGSNGREPYFVQGAGKPVMIDDVNSGIKNAISTNYMNPSAYMNGKYYFTADNGSTGEEMYVYDGNNSPKVVFDPDFGPDSSQPDNYVVFNGNLYYTATTSANGSELYVYDGTNTPTRITDINSGPDSSVYGPVIAYSNKIIFVANTAANGSELWEYNPTTSQTSIIADIDTGKTSSNPANFQVLNNKLYFSATTVQYGRELYMYDGSNMPQRLTDINTSAFSSLSVVSRNAFAFFNNLIYFGARDTSGESHIWSYDPSNSNVKLAHKINPNGDANPREFVVYNNRLFFTVNDGANGYELYAYDGTNTPAIIGDLCPGPNSSLPTGLTPIGDELYFSANNCDNSGVDLFSYNYKRVGIRNVLFDADVNIYPNPVVKNLNIDMELKRDEQLRLRVTDVNGKNIYDTGLLSYKAGKNKTDIPMRNLPPGDYIYFISNQQGTTYLTGKIVKRE
ncbi:MAG: T9SS type A sorting domain-containing protein [Chitinophagales bacterium]|nr:T9SS type A sorting domain-containing protein [Chitinophagales bacterium]